MWNLLLLCKLSRTCYMLTASPAKCSSIVLIVDNTRNRKNVPASHLRIYRFISLCDVFIDKRPKSLDDVRTGRFPYGKDWTGEQIDGPVRSRGHQRFRSPKARTWCNISRQSQTSFIRSRPSPATKFDTVHYGFRSRSIFPEPHAYPLDVSQQEK
jgi:hypothetical protein